MKERPILFSGAMVRCILDGSKTQTRRIMKPQPANDIHPHEFPNKSIQGWMSSLRHKHGAQTAHICPHGKPGDRLWVRESAIIAPKNWNNGDDHNCRDAEGYPRLVQYLATEPSREGADQYKLKASPSMFMPRWASRILLEITDVRVERVQHISREDAKAEGCGLFIIGRGFITEQDLREGPGYSNYLNPRAGFEAVWKKINGADSWDANPWVWAISFQRVQPCA